MTSTVSATREGMSSTQPVEDSRTKPCRKKRTVWTTEAILEEARKYDSRWEFQKKSNRAYQAGAYRGVLGEACAHMQSNIWDRDRIFAEARKYSTRNDFRKGSPGAYQAGCRLGIISAACEHMGMPKSQVWSDNELFEEARKFNTRAEFQRESPRAYAALLNRLLLQEACKHMTPVNKDWSDTKVLFAEALKYETRKAFSVGSPGAYWSARTRGLLDAACLHMAESPPVSDNDTIYLWRANDITHNGMNVYKVGITSARLGDQRIAHVADVSGFTPTIVRLRKVTESARLIERRLLEMGQDPGFTGFGGCTEFRAFTDDEVQFVIFIIDLFTEEPATDH